jgi:hypothetical protein
MGKAKRARHARSRSYPPAGRIQRMTGTLRFAHPTGAGRYGDVPAAGFSGLTGGSRSDGCAVPVPPAAQRAWRYIISTISSYIASASCSPPERIAEDAQCFRWLRISSRPTLRSASCTEEICVMMSAQ